ncbi:MAG: indole-3-glycerol-phosphate synthase [Deltaproteobacteria bacterium]|nr:indole-3-glycerol-phosphate synthase [Deltaproteobacteria bacterium]
MKQVLEAILASKRREVEALARVAPVVRCAEGPRGHVEAALRRAPGAPLRLLTENKKKSPSAGALSTVLDPGARAVRYAEAGAAMISVLTDGPFFDGSWDDVARVRAALEAAGHRTPVLAKEFVVDERQLDEARVSGADAVLVIVRIVDDATLLSLVDGARERGLEPLVEVATEPEVARAVRAGATVIGVNARDLDTLAMDADRAARVLAAIPDGCVPLHLSGVKTPDDVRRLAASRAHGALVGETLMREDDPGPLLRRLVAAASG